ncbi:hypothetical protein [Streptomyces sp. 5-6(2022)]|uniref:hypothetical protein n=1 Tax=Streptomyces sp. 5-6(2022) TaxID=2936510 RepID=UPI0023B96367|nr:hypothetical protein [Streptomyces sp. 5-6(2022)]
MRPTAPTVVIGVGVSLGFSLMLRFGRQYLLARKEAVIELEEYLAWHGGERTVNRRTDDPGAAYLKASPTGAIMMLLPVLVAACWLAVLGMLIAD